MAIGDAIAGALMGIGQSAPQLGKGVGRYITEREYAPLREKASKIMSQLIFGNQQQAEAQAAGATPTTPATSAATPPPTTTAPATPATPPTGPSTSPVVNTLAGFTSTPPQPFDATIPSTAPTTAPTAAPSADNRDRLVRELRDTLSKLEGSPEEQDRAFSRQVTTWLMTEEQRRQETAQRQAEAAKERAHKESMQATSIAAQERMAADQRTFTAEQNAASRALDRERLNLAKSQFRATLLSNPNMTVNDQGEVVEVGWIYNAENKTLTRTTDPSAENAGPYQLAFARLAHDLDMDKLDVANANERRSTYRKAMIDLVGTMGLGSAEMATVLKSAMEYEKLLLDGNTPEEAAQRAESYTEIMSLLEGEMVGKSKKDVLEWLRNLTTQDRMVNGVLVPADVQKDAINALIERVSAHGVPVATEKSIKGKSAYATADALLESEYNSTLDRASAFQRFDTFGLWHPRVKAEMASRLLRSGRVTSPAVTQILQEIVDSWAGAGYLSKFENIPIQPPPRDTTRTDTTRTTQPLGGRNE